MSGTHICTGDELKHTEHTNPTNVCWNLTVGWEEMADSWGFPWHWRNKGQDQGCSDGLVYSGPGIYYKKKIGGGSLEVKIFLFDFLFLFASHKICNDEVNQWPVLFAQLIFCNSKSFE